MEDKNISKQAVADLLAEVRRLREENSIYRSRYGCPSCGEQHPAACMCPPHEVRTTGRCWFDGVRKVMVVEITRLREARERVRLLNRYAPDFDLYMVKDSDGDWIKHADLIAALGEEK